MEIPERPRVEQPDRFHAPDDVRDAEPLADGQNAGTVDRDGDRHGEVSGRDSEVAGDKVDETGAGDDYEPV